MPEPSRAKPETTCARPPAEPDSVSVPLVPPLHLSSVYCLKDLDQVEAVSQGVAPGFIYARDAHPNAFELAAKIAALESAESALVCASGMAAEAAVFLSYLDGGDHVALSEGVYGKTATLV